MTPCCGNCRFYHPSAPPVEGQGECRRYPPDQFPDGEGEFVNSWPLMLADEGCGEFQPAAGGRKMAKEEKHSSFAAEPAAPAGLARPARATQDGRGRVTEDGRARTVEPGSLLTEDGDRLVTEDGKPIALEGEG